MKKYSLATKLIGGFVIVALIGCFVGLYSITQINKIDREYTELYEINTAPMDDLLKITTLYQRSRVNVREVIISGYQAQDFTHYINRLAELDKGIGEAFNRFEKNIRADDIRKIFNSVVAAEKKYDPIRNEILKYAKEGKMAEAQVLLRGDGMKVAQEIDQGIRALTELKIKQAKEKSDANTATTNRTTTVVLMISVMATILSIVLGYFITRSVTVPVNQVVSGLTDGATQVTSASAQMSSASQSLAEGTSEQASSLEETSSSLEEIAAMTGQNADHAKQAKAMMAEANQIIEKVNRHMNDMAASVADITRSSEETGKIIKTIDEIAFQTNLLALNAAVEAARAGEAGAGFAVVADEVRNLALRASDAAKNTSSLIENTIKAVRKGNELTAATQEAFKDNANISKKIGQLVDEIAQASDEQSLGIGQLNKAVSEMEKVTQSTAANAEESAAAAEELNAQAEQLKVYVHDLVEVVAGKKHDTQTSSGFHIASPGVATQDRKRGKTVQAKLPATVSVARDKSLRKTKSITHEEFKDF